MNDEEQDIEELGHRLEAYASVRLSPRRVATARMRASLVEEARMRSLQARLSKRSRRRPARARLTALVLAAALMLGVTAGAAAASTPGGPLYGVRIWLETATLSADPGQRALERLHLIDARIVDVERAAASGNGDAIAAAIAAYRDAVQTAIVEAGTDGMQLADLKSDLGVHVTVLETLADRVPGRAIDGITNAIEASNKAVERIDATKKHSGQGPSDPVPTVVDPQATTEPVGSFSPADTGKPAGSDSQGDQGG